VPHCAEVVVAGSGFPNPALRAELGRWLAKCAAGAQALLLVAAGHA